MARGKASKVFVCRWTEQAWRVALVLHVALHGTKAIEERLSLETARNAICIVDWFSQHQLALLTGGRNTTQRDVVSTVLGLCRAKPDGITPKDLYSCQGRAGLGGGNKRLLSQSAIRQSSRRPDADASRGWAEAPVYTLKQPLPLRLSMCPPCLSPIEVNHGGHDGHDRQPTEQPPLSSSLQNQPV